MNRKRNSKLGTAVATLLVVGSSSAGAAEWKWSLTPYAWATDVGVDVAIDDRTVIDEEISIEELMEDLDTIVQVRLEAQNGAHGLFVDLFDVTLSDDPAEIALPDGSGSAVVTPEMGMTIAELGGLYDPQGDGQGLQFLYGVRMLNERAEIDATFQLADGSTVARPYEVDDTFVDALLGIRYLTRFSPRWSLETRADLSAGGTELTWSAGPRVGYTFGRTSRYTATAGYRRMVVELDTEGSVAAEMTLSGFLAGLRIDF